MCVLKEKYKDQIILGVIIFILGIILTIVVGYFNPNIAIFVVFLSLSILLLYLLIILVKNISNLEKLIKSNK